MTKAVEFSISQGKSVAEKFPLHDGPDPCSDLHTLQPTNWTLRCTREPGHDGQHVAHNVRGEAVAAWKKE